jgi:hypothetical protein
LVKLRWVVVRLMLEIAMRASDGLLEVTAADDASRAGS